MLPPPTALPEGSVLLHIGPHKTGTTAIQGALAAARAELAEHGVTYPGHAGAHHPEARALRRHPAGWVDDTEPLPDQKVWRKFTRAVNRDPGRVVVSSELFAQSDAAERAQVVEGLDRDRLQLVVAARNPGSIAISTWQQVLRDGKAGRLEDWLEHRFRRQAPALTTSGFWSWADAATLGRSVERGDRSRPHPRDRHRRVGPDAARLDVRAACSVSPKDCWTRTCAPRATAGSPPPEAELLRQVIALAKDKMTWADFTLLIRGGFVRRLQTVRTPPPSDPRPALPQWAAAQAAEEADAIIGRLRVSGAHIIGDLENLRRVPAASASPPLDEIPTEMAAEAVTGVITAALRGMARAERQAAGRQPRRQQRPPAGRSRSRRCPPGSWQASSPAGCPPGSGAGSRAGPAGTTSWTGSSARPTPSGRPRDFRLRRRLTYSRASRCIPR